MTAILYSAMDGWANLLERAVLNNRVECLYQKWVNGIDEREIIDKSCNGGCWDMKPSDWYFEGLIPKDCRDSSFTAHLHYSL